MKTQLELTVMMYHYVRDAGDAAEAGSRIPGLPVRAFAAQLDELTKRYTFVSWPEVRMALNETRPLPESPCLLTFDDGLCDHYLNVFRILRERDLSGLFFIMARRADEGLTLAHRIHFLLAELGVQEMRESICEGLDPLQQNRFLEAEKKYRLRYPVSADGGIDLLKAVLQRDLSGDVDWLLSSLFENYIGPEKEIARTYYLDPGQIREMAAGGMHFGGHSSSHPWFDWIDARSREDEIEASAECLRQIEPGPWAFAYPYGGLAEDSAALLEQHGFIAAFTTKAQLRHSNPYLIGRLDGEELAQIGNTYG